MSATISDVARRAGVSTATVSRILSGASASRPATVRAVRAAVEALDYRPSGIARSLKLRSTGTLGLIVTDVQNPFFPELVRAVEDVAWELGLAVLLCNAAGVPEREAGYLKLLEERRVDGLIVAASRLPAAHEATLGRSGVPVAVVNCEAPVLTVPTIVSDNRAGGRLAVEHLAGLGHTKIAAITAPAEQADAPVRLAGFRDGLLAAGLDPDAAPVETAAGTVASGEAATRRLLAANPATTAIVCYNDLTAIGAMRALRAAGRRVPLDASVVGFDDIAAAAWVEPPLTTIVQQKTAMGRWAVERIAAELRTPQPARPPERVVLPVTLCVRASTAPPPAIARAAADARAGATRRGRPGVAKGALS